MRKNIVPIEALVDLMDSETYDILGVLLSKGYSVNLNKLRVIKYILDNPNSSMFKLSNELEIDYKNTWRIIQELKKERILAKDDVSKGKKAKLKIIPSKTLSKEKTKEVKKVIDHIKGKKK